MVQAINFVQWVASAGKEKVEGGVSFANLEIFPLVEKVRAFVASFFSQLPTVGDILDGKYAYPKIIYQVAAAGLVGGSIVGTGGAFALWWSGMPTSAVVMMVLAVANTLGAYVANEALLGEGLKENLEEMKAVNARLEGERILFGKHNETLRTNIQDFASQNQRLGEQVTTMTGQVDRLTVNNQAYEMLTEKFREHLELHVQRGTVNQEALRCLVDELDRQMQASASLWEGVFREAQQARADRDTHIRALQGLIAQITDPESTRERLGNLQAINDQIRQANVHLAEMNRQISQLETQIAARDGQLQERNAVFQMLSEMHQRILENYGMQNEEFQSSNETLRQQLGQIEHFFGQAP